jgi:hypothetical protein
VLSFSDTETDCHFPWVSRSGRAACPATSRAGYRYPQDRGRHRPGRLRRQQLLAQFDPIVLVQAVREKHVQRLIVRAGHGTVDIASSGGLDREIERVMVNAHPGFAEREKDLLLGVTLIEKLGQGLSAGHGQWRNG